MANYSKNRPVFKSQAEIYKKPKWTKFKESVSLYFSNLKRWFAKVSYKINEKGTQRLTIMIVPHTEKKIINLQISNYILFFTSIVLTVTIFTSVLAISNNQQINKQYDQLKGEDEVKRAQIESYKHSIESVNKRFTMFKSDINNIMKSTGKDKSIYADDQIAVGDEYTNKSKPKEVVYLDKLKQELDITKTELQFLGDFITKYKKLLKDMPSSYPLPMTARITSGFGYRIDPLRRENSEFHPGIDFSGMPGTSVLAAADGVVTYAGWMGGYGNAVDVTHKYGFLTRYGHMERFGPGITVGSVIKQGQVLGYVGATGRATGYHLHFELHIGDKVVDPSEYTTIRP